MPASTAAAEPSGSPFRFSGTQSAERLSLASAANGQVLSSWSLAGSTASATARLLGTSGPLDVRRALSQGRGSLAANTSLNQYLRVWQQPNGREATGRVSHHRR